MSTGASTPGTAKADALLAEAQSATADEEKTYDMDAVVDLRAPPTAERPAENPNDDPCMRTLTLAERREETAKLNEMLRAMREGKSPQQVEAGARLDSIELDPHSP